MTATEADLTAADWDANITVDLRAAFGAYVPADRG